MALGFDLQNKIRYFGFWSDLKPYIDGTSGSLAYNWALTPNNSYYLIATEPYVGFNYVCYLENTASSERTDFENNYKNLALRDASGSFTDVRLVSSSLQDIGVQARPLWITGSVATGGSSGGTVIQGNAGSIAQSWYVQITDGSAVRGTTIGNGLYVSGTINQGPSGSVPWKVELTSGSTQVATQANPIWITGSVATSGGSGGTVTQGASGSVPWKFELYSGSTQIGTSTTPVIIDPYLHQTFQAYVTGAAIGNGKSMISLFNSSSQFLIKVKEIYITLVQTAAVTGILANFFMYRITSHSTGTDVTMDSFDTADAIPTGVTAKTNATITGRGGKPLRRWIFNTDEIKVSTLDSSAQQHLLYAQTPAYRRFDLDAKPLVLRQNEGVDIQQTINSTVGIFDLCIVYTQEST